MNERQLTWAALLMSAGLIGIISLAPPSDAQPDGEHTILMEVTGYCPCAECCDHFAEVPWDDRKTAGGYPLNMVTAMVAAPPEYPFETLMQIPGYAGGRRVHVLDRGGAIHGNRLDVYFWDHALARQFGRRMLWVKVRARIETTP